MKKMILTIIITYIVLLWDFEATYQHGNNIHKIEYNGIVWVVLDYYSIIKYHSDDKPMKWIYYNNELK